MLLKYFYDERLAQASYLVGCERCNAALVVDPARDVAPYVAAARAHGLTISHVTETHIHADFLSGARELAAATGATMMLSDTGDDDWKYAFARADGAQLVRAGDEWMVGNVRVKVMASGGHTPEHISFIITDTFGADRPMGIFSGDAVFVGDVGRPDLLEAAVGVAGSSATGARELFKTVHRFKSLPDYFQLWPAHGAGSACGKSLGAVPSSTLGYEKLFNPAFQFDDEAEFARWLLEGQPEPPRYFAQMKHLNKQGPPLLRDAPTPRQLDRAALDAAIAAGDWVFDLRSARAFARGHIRGTLSVATSETNYITKIGWFADYARPSYFIAPSAARVPDIVTAFHSIGLDNIGGYFLPDVVTEPAEVLPTMAALELADAAGRSDVVVIDVRNRNEWDEGHLAVATHIPLGYLPQHLGDLPRSGKLVLHCASGYRSIIGASYLRARGFDNVSVVTDRYEALASALPAAR